MPLVWLADAGRAAPPGTLPHDGPAAPTDRPAPRWRELPFAQRLDMRVVDEVTRSAPERLLATIARHDVEVRRVRTEGTTRPPNPLLAPLPDAPAELLQRAEFRDTYEGRVLLRDPACGRPRDTLLVRDIASTYTLLHEFVHSRLQPLDDCTDDEDVELRFAVEFRRLQLYQRRLYDDPFRLLDPQWRHDIHAAQAAVAARLFRRIQIGQSQEPIVEKVLAGAIDERSPYHDPPRRAEGLRYGAAMIDNAIDLFNSVEAGVTYVRETVRHLHAQVRAGRIEPPAPLRLTDADAQAAEEADRRLAPPLARVRSEILALKRFFTG